jgi:hypothetical protein
VERYGYASGEILLPQPPFGVKLARAFVSGVSLPFISHSLVINNTVNFFLSLPKKPSLQILYLIYLFQ